MTQAAARSGATGLVYLDTTVALAELLAEDRRPPPALWERPLVASRLLQYELRVRLNAMKLGETHGDAAAALVARVALVELRPETLARALEPFPAPVRTLDALHLATIEFLRGRGQAMALASYDERLIAAARALGIAVAAA